jgi:hypothetical protein
MPCRSGEPTIEEIEYDEQYKNNPIFKREIIRLRSIIEEQGARYSRVIEKLTKKSTQSDVETLAFSSFMSVFLCKAMGLIESNGLIQHTYHEMEWWYGEHKKRDRGELDTSISDVLDKLGKINNKFKVD